MTVKQTQSEFDCIYFITFSCYKWLYLIDITSMYDHIYSWFHLMIKNNIKVVGYVIMPNHMHLLIYLPKMDKTLNTIIGNGKRFMAYDIVERLKTLNKLRLLSTLEKGVSEKERREGKLHRVFNESFDSKIYYTSEFVEQKLDYMHLNPVEGKWNLVEDHIDYKHSSAKFYELGEELCIPITHYLEFFEE